MQMSQFSGNFSGSGESDEDSRFLPDFSLPPVPYFVYIPVLAAVVAVLVCACVGWLGCCILCRKYKRYRKVSMHKREQEELGGIRDKGVEMREAIMCAGGDQEGATSSDEGTGGETVTVEEGVRGVAEQRERGERTTSDTPGPTGSQPQASHRETLNSQQPPADSSSTVMNGGPSTSGNQPQHHPPNEQPPPTTPNSTSTAVKDQWTSPTNYASNSLPNELTASGKLAVSPPEASTLPGHRTHSVNTNNTPLQLRPVYGELNGQVVNIRRTRQRKTSSYQEESTHAQWQLMETTPRRHSSTGQETYPSQRSSIGHGDVFESLERVRPTMKSKSSPSSQDGGKETSV